MKVFSRSNLMVYILLIGFSAFLISQALQQYAKVEKAAESYFAMPPTDEDMASAPIRLRNGNLSILVQKGDTVYSIAKRFDTNLWEIVFINNLPDDGKKIKVGQRLEIPTKTK